jgi:hypothetical protein
MHTANFVLHNLFAVATPPVVQPSTVLFSLAINPQVTFNLSLPSTYPFTSFPGGSANLTTAITSLVVTTASLPNTSYVNVSVGTNTLSIKVRSQ